MPHTRARRESSARGVFGLLPKSGTTGRALWLTCRLTCVIPLSPAGHRPRAPHLRSARDHKFHRLARPPHEAPGPGPGKRHFLNSLLSATRHCRLCSTRTCTSSSCSPTTRIQQGTSRIQQRTSNECSDRPSSFRRRSSRIELSSSWIRAPRLPFKETTKSRTRRPRATTGATTATAAKSVSPPISNALERTRVRPTRRSWRCRRNGRTTTTQCRVNLPKRTHRELPHMSTVVLRPNFI